MTNSAPFRVLGFKKLLFVNLPDMSDKNLYKRIQECWLYLIWLLLLADLFSVSRTKALNTTDLCILWHGGGRGGLIDDVSNTCMYMHTLKTSYVLLRCLSKTVLRWSSIVLCSRDVCVQINHQIHACYSSL